MNEGKDPKLYPIIDLIIKSIILWSAFNLNIKKNIYTKIIYLNWIKKKNHE
jgi:hypothetical protein